MPLGHWIVVIVGLLLVQAADGKAQLRVLGDVNCDDVLDGSDFATMIDTIFGGSTSCPTADVNEDTILSAADLAALAMIPYVVVSTPTPTASATATLTPTIIDSAVPTPTESPLATATTTPPPATSSTPSLTPTATTSAKPTDTSTVTATPSLTATGMRTTTPTRTATITYTATPTWTMTRSTTPSRTQTISPTGSPTRTPTPTRSNTRTPTNTWTATTSPTPSITRTPSSTRTITSTPLPTRTPTITRTPTPSRTPTATQPIGAGPSITFFGLVSASNRLLEPVDSVAGVAVFQQPAGLGTGFFIVIEAKPGLSGVAPGVSQFTDDPGGRPDLQILSSRDLGSGAGIGSAAVCDTMPPNVGGVPGFSSPNFDPNSQAVTDALNDFGCRFENNTSDPCILNDGDNSTYANPDSTVQFCTGGTISRSMEFPTGDTVLAVQWRDLNGNIGSPARIIVRVP